MPGTKNYSIEFLRIVFTIYIVLRHTLAASGVYPENCLWLGVEFFFVLSGFLLFLNYHSSERSVFSFLVNRYARFVPLTVFGCLLCMPFVPIDFSKLVANTLLLSETGLIVGGGAVNPPTWYFSVLVWGAVIYLMLFRFPRGRNMILGLITLFCLASMRKSGYEPLGESIDFCGVSHRFIRGVGELGLGCLAAIVYLKIRDFRLPRALPTVFEVVATLVALLMPFAPIWRHPGCISILLLVDAILVVMFFLSSGKLSQWLNRPYWGYFSQYALSLFCTHYATTFAIGKFFNRCYGMSERWAVSGCAVVVSLILAVVARRFVEIPCSAILNRIRSFFRCGSTR